MLNDSTRLCLCALTASMGLLDPAVGQAPPAAAPAAEAAAEPASPIVVTGRGLPGPTAGGSAAQTTLTPSDRSSAASGRLEDLLGTVPGFQQFRRSDSRAANPSAQGVTLRGLGGNATSRTLVLLDGVPVTDPFFGYVPFPALPWDRLERITVTRGGSSAAFGAGAVAGTIALESAGADALDPVSAAALISDRADSEVAVTAAPRLGSGFAAVSGRWDRGQGYWTTPPDQRGAASVRSEYQSWSASLRAVAPLGRDFEVQGRLLLFDDRRTLRFAGADTASSGQDVSLRLVGRGAWQVDALAYLQARDFSNVVISATALRRTLDQRSTPATGLGAKVEIRPPLGAYQTLQIGLDWRRASGDMREDAYSAVTGQITARRSAGGTNDNLGLFAEYHRTLGPLRLSGSARLDRWVLGRGYFREVNAAGFTVNDQHFADRGGWAGSLRGSLLLQAGADLALRAAAYQGLRLPTLNELYRPFVVFPVTTRANAALALERLTGFEAGADWKPDTAVRIGVTLFDNRVKAAIANVTIAPNLRERRNLDAVRSRGVELDAAVDRGQLSLVAGLSWLQAEVQGSGPSAALDGKRPAQVPAVSASATLAWRPAVNWRLSGTLRHSGSVFEDDLETDRLPAATTLEAVFAAPLGQRLTLVLRGENLLGANIVTRNQAGSIDLGAPRTLWAGLQVRLPH